MQKNTINIHRLQEEKIIQDLKEKMVFLVGPRQVGKTYLAKKIGEKFKNTTYLNFDAMDDRKIILNQSWDYGTELLILDELHKMKNWKNYIKGLYDTKQENLKILVTGSARMETFRKSGDSLAGRFYVHHLLPLSYIEIHNKGENFNLKRLLERGGFPEPFLVNEEERVFRWRKFYTDSMIREDVLDFEKVDDMRALYNVFEILRNSVSSNISYKSIGEVVGVSPTTVKKYISILESLYIVFRVKTYTKNIKRSILKETKVYFYDIGLVVGDQGKVFENLIALELSKYVNFKNDNLGLSLDLFYLRNKEQKEADFVIVSNDNKMETIFEVKLSDTNVSKNLLYFTEKYDTAGIQVVLNTHIDSFSPTKKIKIQKAEFFLKNLI